MSGPARSSERAKGPASVSVAARTPAPSPSRTAETGVDDLRADFRKLLERQFSALEWLSDPDDPRFQAAMRNTCEICDAKPRRPCWNTINTADPLPNRLIHHARTHPKGKAKEAKDDE